jgi:hypothetical protein
MYSLYMAFIINGFDIENILQITNTMLHVVAPIYGAHNLIFLIFSILSRSPHHPLLHTLTQYEGAILANNLLIMVSYFGVTSVLLVLSINKEHWKVNGDVIPKSLFTFPFAKLQD